jgi:hypothetical protein
MKLKLLIFLFLVLFSQNSYPGYDEAYFKINNKKYMVSELNLKIILDEFGSNYEPIEVKTVALVDANLKPINQTSFIRLIYKDEGIEFFIKCNKEIPLSDGFIQKNTQIDFTEIRPEEVRIYSKDVTTNVGVEIGDSQATVENLFGKSEAGWAPVIYRSIGLGFDLDEQKEVKQISISKPY